MKIKFRLIAIISFVVVCFSCNKNNDSPTTKLELLTSKTWKYDEYFRNYNSSPTVLYYKRGKTSNLLNLDQNRVTFKSDGSYSEITETGATLSGTWQFLNNETEVQVNNINGTFTSTIIILEDQRYYWYDSFNSNGTYGKMIPQ